jgi:hypothetical protein
MPMKAPMCAIAGLLLLAGLSAAQAAPNVPAGDRPGRDRQRFLESPVERFMQPTQQTEPLIQWQCDTRKPRSKKRPSRSPC